MDRDFYLCQRLSRFHFLPSIYGWNHDFLVLPADKWTIKPVVCSEKDFKAEQEVVAFLSRTEFFCFSLSFWFFDEEDTFDGCGCCRFRFICLMSFSLLTLKCFPVCLVWHCKQSIQAVNWMQFILWVVEKFHRIAIFEYGVVSRWKEFYFCLRNYFSASDQRWKNKTKREKVKSEIHPGADVQTEMWRWWELHMQGFIGTVDKLPFVKYETKRKQTDKTEQNPPSRKKNHGRYRKCLLG